MAGLIKLSDVPDYVWADGEVVLHSEDGSESRKSCRWKFRLVSFSDRKEIRKESRALQKKMAKLGSKYEPTSLIREWLPDDQLALFDLQDSAENLRDRVFDKLTGWEGIADEVGEPLPFNEKNKQAVIDHPAFESSIRTAFDSIGQGEEARVKNSETPPDDGRQDRATDLRAV